MKINRKKQLLESIDMMKECHQHIGNTSNEGEILELLQLCQDMAVQVGNLVEEQKIDANSCELIITELEQYCDDIFQVSQKLELGEEAKKQAVMVCDATLNKGEALLNECASEKMVAVFLPYNASMWDALDTVCRSAMGEIDWDTYVMPIPYYSLNAKREVDQSHYEYDLFPHDLPLVDYAKYTLESLQPDVIFYHNPYDDWNLVTSVHPDYYSKNLLKVTKNLVYIPYYLSESRTADYMVTLPGIQNAWKVIVQTEEMQRQFLEKYAVDKIVNLGTPKLDRLLIEANHSPELPLEWKEKIEGKKVVFFNTHLTSVMNQPEKFIEMLTHVMEVMARNRDIVILWRPHPLMKETITSFHNKPLLKKQYEQCIQTFQSLPNAIYDESSELHRSMAISHGYMGTERSSVFHMYKYLKRPMYGMKDIFEGEPFVSDFIPKSVVGVVDGDSLWQIDYRLNALFRTNLVSGISDYVTTFPRNSVWQSPTYQCRAQQNGWLICVPLLGGALVLYEISTGRTEYVALEAYDFAKPGGWLVDCYDNEILVVRLDVMKSYYAVSMDTFTSKKLSLSTQDTDANVVMAYNQEIWTYNEKKKILESYHHKSGAVRQYTIPVKLKLGQVIPMMHVDQGNLYLLDRECATLISILNYLGEYEVKIINVGEGERRLTFTQFIGTTLFFSFIHSAMVYAYDITKGELQVIIEDEMNVGGITYSYGAKEENRIVIMPNSTSNQGFLIEANNDCKEVAVEQYKPLSVSNIDELQKVLEESDAKGYVIRDEVCSLESFWKERVEVETDEQLEEYASSGELIWEYVRDRC